MLQEMDVFVRQRWNKHACFIVYTTTDWSILEVHVLTLPQVGSLLSGCDNCNGFRNVATKLVLESTQGKKTKQTQNCKS